jgi:Carboxypeptidase regulatory-like domain
VVAGAQVVVIEIQTGVRTEMVTDAKGFYNFPALAIGTYDLEVHQPGFKTFRQTNIVIDASSAVKVDVALQVGTTSESVEVRSDAVQVVTQNTQMGEVITGTRMTSVPFVPNLDAISEFRIITNNFNAEYGNFSGGQVNVATKSGTNDIHGSAFEFFRNTALDARNFFNPADTGPKGKFDQN